MEGDNKMLENGKISALQMALIIEPTVTSTAILVVPSVTATLAERDMWISPIFGSLVGFFSVFIVYQLHKRYPNKSIIQYSGDIIGRIPGKIIGLIFLFFFLHASGIITREYAEFINVAFLPKTPIMVVMGGMILICAFTVRSGLEVLGRVAQLFFPIFMAPMLLFILLMPDVKLENMVPIMEHGMMPSILSATIPQGWFSEVSLISMLLPFLTDREKGAKWGIISVIIIMLHLGIINIVCLLLFGESVNIYAFPAFSAIKYISVATFFEHLEAIVIIIWVMGAFIKISVFYYVLVLGTAQWLNLSDYRPIVLPLGFLVSLFCIWSAANGQELGQFLRTISPFYISTIMTFIPMLLLLITIIRKKKWKEKRNPALINP
jgi:spore germination protein KB